ncbi:hypothetical protein ACWEPH_12960, partial [Nocardia beijingensis]
MPVSEPPESATANVPAEAVPPSRTGGASTDGEPAAALGPELAAVVERWNPQGMALLRAVRDSGAAGAVTVIGPADVNTTLLRTELARFEPRLTLSEPHADAMAGAETSPPAVALILLDAGTIIGADTLGVIDRLRADGARVLLAMNGIHAHQDWQAVRERDMELLAAVGAGDLDIVPVSARLAAAARTAGDAGLLDRSGVGALHAQLTAATAAGGDRQDAVVGRVIADDVVIATPDANIGMGGPAMIEGGGLGVYAPEE